MIDNTDMKVLNERKLLLNIYESLLQSFGPRHWWPAETPFEVMIGAILTQNVSWINVNRAIQNLKNASLLDAKKMQLADEKEIAKLIKSSRYYNLKARKIKNFLNFYFDEYDGNLSEMANEEISDLRKKLLEINGLGEETVDSILLYACDKPIFVVDAYTKRIFSRYGFFDEKTKYRDVQVFFMKRLEKDTNLFNDYHAQIVHLGNTICKKNPDCSSCPIKQIKPDIVCDYFISMREKER